MGVIDAAINTVIKESTGSLTAKEVVHLLPDAAFEGIPGELIGTLTLLALCAWWSGTPGAPSRLEFSSGHGLEIAERDVRILDSGPPSTAKGAKPRCRIFSLRSAFFDG